MINTNCIFCKIAEGEIPSKTIYEDEKFRVILDLGPATKGHALILPKQRYANIFEIPEKEVGEAFILAKKIAVIIKEKLNCDGFNIIQNNEKTAGQTVFHFHIHLIPRYFDDGQKINWQSQDVMQEELEEVKAQIIN